MQNDTPKVTTQQQTCHIRQNCIKWEIVDLHRSRYQICCQTVRLNVCTRSMQTPDSFPHNCLQTASAHLPWTRQRWQAALVQTNLSLEVHRITRCFFTVLKNSTDWEVIASWFWQVYLSETQPMYTFCDWSRKARRCDILVPKIAPKWSANPHLSVCPTG